ncbi:signal peptidase II [Asticcacaulis tiandongensis]|uniref:signal peptidase II n=1 Tax=Asticcacaulis tiandongensis TaxID=2565365 RepID=UPI001129443F|nr:signal peptidase II [Asticcacaulis tiandongensis]
MSLNTHFAAPITTALGRKGLLVALVALILDQVSKWWILYELNLALLQQVKISPLFSFTMVWNKGVSFGLLSSDGWGRWVLVVFSLGVAVFLIDWLRKGTKPVLTYGLALVAGGAIGNAIDRIYYGAVVDFLDFSGLYFPWVFNIADAAINIGVACLFLDVFLLSRSETKDDTKHS